MQGKEQPKKESPAVPAGSSALNSLLGQSDDDELESFQQFLAKQKKPENASTPLGSGELRASTAEELRRLEFGRVLEKIESAAPSADVQNDPEWAKFNQYLRREATVSDAEDSGQKGAVLPDDLKGWNWGACLMNVIWGAAMKVPVGTLFVWGILTMIIPIFPFYLLFKGNELAWQNRRWASKEEFRLAQRKWTLYGLVIGVLLGLVCVIFFFWLRRLLGGIDPGMAKFLMPALF